MRKVSLLMVSVILFTLNFGVYSCKSEAKKSANTIVPASVVAQQPTNKAADEPVKSLEKGNMQAEIHTKKGVMKVTFYEKDAPNTVANFVKLAKSGFYNGLTFHRVIPNFVIQGGCPNGTGSGGPGYTIKCELDGDNQYHDRGVLSMAHAGRDTGGSQFFICHGRQNTQHLDRNHTCFGKVYEGLDVIDKIAQGDVIEKIVIIEE